jgi:tetratricopeptide (TPR) repeat protein
MEPLPYDGDIRIIKYLSNDMTPEERSAFEIEIEKNTSLREALVFEKELLQLGQSAGEKVNNYYTNDEESRDEEVKTLIAEAGTTWENQLPAAPGKPVIVKRIPILKIPGVAAALGGIIILTALYLFTTKKDTSTVRDDKMTDTLTELNKSDSSFQKIAAPENIAKENQQEVKAADDKNKHHLLNNKRNKLFADNFKPDALPPDIPDLLQEPFAYYKSAQYDNAIAAFKNIDPGFSTRGDATDKKKALFYIDYYKSLSYLANNNASKAIPGLQKAIKESPDKSYTIKAKWYLALSNLKTDNFKTAIDILSQLAADDRAGEYKNKSVKVRDEMIKNELR